MIKTTFAIKAVIICLILGLPFNGNSQNDHEIESCGTEVTQENLNYLESLQEQLKFYEEEYYEKLQNRSSTAISQVPIKAHIIRTTSGGGGLSESELNDAIANVNAFYADAFMEFYICDGINYIDDTDLYFYETNQEGTLTANNVSGLINIYFTQTITSSSSGGGLCGYAYLPGGPDVILMANNCTINGSTLPHEIGHFFSLLHTHGPSNSTLTTELVDGSNCDVAGDFICDTPADPQLSTSNVTTDCIYTGTAVDANGDLFVPDPTNIMSYSRKECRDYFSPQQFARIYASFQTARHYFACPSFNAQFTSSFTRDCSDSMTVDFTDTSTGAVSWEWDVDGDDIIDYTVQNPSHVYGPGTYDVTLTVSDGTNTLTNVFANYVEFETEVVNTTQVHLELFTDAWCEETTWEFRDGSGTVLYSGGPYQQNVEDFTLFNETFEVNLDECYVFEIFDSYGDGICCFSGNGYYELKSDDDTVIVNGGAYGFGEETYISNETLSVDEFLNNSIGLFPNPASEIMQIKVEGQGLPDTYRIYNILGQLVSQKQIETFSDLDIRVQDFENGMYFIKIEKDGSSKSIPFLKN